MGREHVKIKLTNTQTSHSKTESYTTVDNLPTCVDVPCRVKSSLVLKLENVPIFNVGFLWNSTSDSWSAIGRWHQSCHQCGEGKELCPPHPINTIAYSSDACNGVNSFVPHEVPKGVVSDNIGEPKWTRFYGRPAIIAYTNGHVYDSAFNEEFQSTLSWYKNYMLKNIPWSDNDLIPIQYEKQIEADNPTTKNFLYFQHEERMYVVTLVLPHTVYEMHDTGLIEVSGRKELASYGIDYILHLDVLYVILTSSLTPAA